MRSSGEDCTCTPTAARKFDMGRTVQPHAKHRGRLGHQYGRSSNGNSIRQRCKVKPISRRTVGRYKKQIDFHTGNAKTTTTARAEAVHDPRNALSFAAMNACCVPMSTPELIINVDATQFSVGDKAWAPPKAVWCEKRPDNLKVVPKRSGMTNYFIKYYANITAAGAQADPIYIVADEGIAVKDFRAEQVISIGARSSPREKGWVVFAKTRVPKIDFYKWYLKIFFVPWVQELRQIYGVGVDVPAYFQLDGEAAQIGPFLEDTYIRQLMTEHKIMSTTRNFHSKGITDSFRVTGLYPFDQSIILGNCTADITQEEQLHYCSVLGRLKQHFMEHAEIKEWFFDRLGIRAGQDRSFDKAVSHRRSILLSSNAFWAGEQEKTLAKENAAIAKEANKERIR
ncbi:hypothetical protein B484DRAFT_466098 [Ochromonadaceae sp. CCMP2298]|nr:hypothetical protein B484DRAFT_466098 [Ochromonadaceae sp. CCMP2298]